MVPLRLIQFIVNLTMIKRQFKLKKIIFLIAISIASVPSVIKAQVYEKTTVHAGANLSEASYYLFPSFTDATVKLKKGELISKMNFNLLICQMQFINEHGDTLNIARPADIDTIALDSSLFFYKDEGYYEIFAAADFVKLAVVRKVSYEALKNGAFGLASHSGAGIESYTSFISQSGEKQLVLNEDVNILKETTYFLIDSNGEKLKANKSNFLKLFSKDKQLIEAYLKQSKFNFDKQSDLKKLFHFCIHLV